MLENASAANDLDLISYLRSVPDARMRRGVRFPAWYLLLVAVLGILSGCQSLRDLERFAIRHHGVLTEALGQELRQPRSDSSFLYFFHQVDVAALCAAIRDWTIAQIPGGAADLDQLVCVALGLPRSGWQDPERLDGAHGRRRFRIHCPGHAVFGRSGRGDQPGLLRHHGQPRAGGSPAADWRAGSGRRAHPGRRTPYPAPVFRQLQEQGADFLLTVKGNQKTLHRQISSQFQGTQNPFCGNGPRGWPWPRRHLDAARQTGSRVSSDIDSFLNFESTLIKGHPSASAR